MLSVESLPGSRNGSANPPSKYCSAKDVQVVGGGEVESERVGASGGAVKESHTPIIAQVNHNAHTLLQVLVHTHSDAELRRKI